MKCPYCGFDDSKVIDSRPTDDKIRRRRECIKCSGRFTTYEAIEIPLLMVEKRPVTKAQVDDIADYVENYCADRLKTVIKSEEIGNIVLDRLREIDPISYIRFASVYKDFTDIASFVAVISEFDENKAN